MDLFLFFDDFFLGSAQLRLISNRSLFTESLVSFVVVVARLCVAVVILIVRVYVVTAVCPAMRNGIDKLNINK